MSSVLSIARLVGLISYNGDELNFRVAFSVSAQDTLLAQVAFTSDALVPETCTVCVILSTSTCITGLRNSLVKECTATRRQWRKQLRNVSYQDEDH